MKSSRLRDLIKNQDRSISFEEYRLRYVSERFLMRMQKSQYKDNFILKGGFLLGAIYKTEQRTTKDLDTLLKNTSADRVNVEKMLEDIIGIDLGDAVHFELVELLDAQKQRVYDGFRAKLKMSFSTERTYILFDLDIGVGDTVTPGPKIVEIPLLFNENKGEQAVISLYSCPLETILAEKTEIILTLGLKNSRMKDFYDIQLILNDPNKPDITESYNAFENTWRFRHPQQPIDGEIFNDWQFVIEELKEDDQIKEVAWKNYTKDREYAKNLRLESILQQFHSYLLDLQLEFEKRNS